MKLNEQVLRDFIYNIDKIVNEARDTFRSKEDDKKKIDKILKLFCQLNRLYCYSRPLLESFLEEKLENKDQKNEVESLFGSVKFNKGEESAGEYTRRIREESCE